MYGTLALAASIAELTRVELRELLAQRPLASPASIRDPLGLAVELLRPELVAAAVQGLDRESLSILLAIEAAQSDPSRGPALASLRLLGLIGVNSQPSDRSHQPLVDDTDPAPTHTERASRYIALPEVTAALEELEADARLRATTETRAAATDDAVASSTWFGAALAATSRAAALLRELELRPAKLSRRGVVTVAAQRELAASTHDDPELTGQLLQTLKHAGLVEPLTLLSRTLLEPSPAADRWLDLRHPERWLALATAHVAACPPQLRHALAISIASAGDDLDSADGPDSQAVDLARAAGALLSHEFPLLPQPAHDAAVRWVATAELLGLSVNGWSTPPALRLLTDDQAAALTLAARDFPPPAAGVYLQPDLSLIAPGPLAPSDERILTVIADTEHLGAASTLRLSRTSITRALRAGHSIPEIRDTLTRLSLTGIPQPLDYLLGDIERKLSQGIHTHDAGSTWAEHVARRVGAPAAAERTRAATTAADHPPRTSTDSNDATDMLDDIALRVSEAARQNDGAGDLARRLELAIRDRSPVRVTAVAPPNPQEYTFTLLPVSLSGGRLRATDQAAGVERTLPVSAIVAVDAA